MILLNYILFAVFATILNLSSQFVYLKLTPLSFCEKEIAILIGTGVGLVVKYVLDKLFIFRFEATNEAETFTLYSIMGLFTTLIFWGCEYTAIILAPESEFAMYVGAVIGLGIGYIVKYFLDKKYVFKTN